MDERWNVAGPKVIEVGGPGEEPRALEVRIVRGQVDVVAHDDLSTIRVEVTAVGGRPLYVVWDGATLDVSHPRLRWESLLENLTGLGSMDSVDISIAVPRGVEVHLGTVSAEGLLSGTTAKAQVRTVSGTIVVNGVGAHVDARTVSGSIEVREQRGPFTGNSVSGALTVHASDSHDLHARTVSGALTIDLERAPATVVARTVSGDVMVRIPAAAGYELSASSVSGRVTAGGEQLARRPGKVEGMLRGGDGAVKVVSHTVSGDVTLLHAAAAAPGHEGAGGSPSMRKQP